VGGVLVISIVCDQWGVTIKDFISFPKIQDHRNQSPEQKVMVKIRQIIESRLEGGE
jgi:hypothetical protein